MLTFDPDLAAKLRRGKPCDVLDRAFRLRAGFIGAAQSCLCTWPIDRHPTPTEHAEGCPASYIIESMMRAREASSP